MFSFVETELTNEQQITRRWLNVYHQHRDTYQQPAPLHVIGKLCPTRVSDQEGKSWAATLSQMSSALLWRGVCLNPAELPCELAQTSLAVFSRFLAWCLMLGASFPISSLSQKSHLLQGFWEWGGKWKFIAPLSCPLNLCLPLKLLILECALGSSEAQSHPSALCPLSQISLVCGVKVKRPVSHALQQTLKVNPGKALFFPIRRKPRVCLFFYDPKYICSKTSRWQCFYTFLPQTLPSCSQLEGLGITDPVQTVTGSSFFVSPIRLGWVVSLRASLVKVPTGDFEMRRRFLRSAEFNSPRSVLLFVS